jgi:hypothetical protein
MGLGDFLKSVGTAVAEKAEEMNEIRRKYEGMDDDELVRIVQSDGFFGPSKTEKMIASSVLKKRGISVR